MLKKPWIALVAVAFAFGPPAAAQGGSPWFGEVELFGMQFENFFQRPGDEPEEDVSALKAELEVGRRLGPDSGWSWFLNGGGTFYESELDDSTTVGTGLRYDRASHEAEIEFSAERERPVFDVGDEFDRADTVGLEARYSWRATDAWELTPMAELERQEFDLTPRKDNDIWLAGGEIRYRGWGYEFSPAIGAMTGTRDADDPNEDHDQTDTWVKLRSVPASGLYLSLRYRHRVRDYTIDDVLASNVGRQDDRDQWTFLASYRFFDHYEIFGYYDYLDADSDKASRVFTSQLVGLGLKLHL